MILDASAKLMLAGEYSVLFGGICLVATCPEKAIAQFEPGTHWNFSSITNSSNNTSQKIFTSARLASENLGYYLQKGSYLIDTSAFYSQTGNKLGLGSSAAAATALARIILAQQGIDNNNILLKLALETHKIFSDSLGSGADVAAAVYNTTIEFYNSSFGPVVNPVELSWWPKLLRIDTQRPQDTRSFVAKVLSFAEHNKSFFKQFVKDSDHCCKALQENLSFEEIGQIFDELYNLLRSLGTLAKLDIISIEHQKIHELAHSFCGTAKPSGAGGGDFSIALVPLEEQENFIKCCVTSGFTVY